MKVNFCLSSGHALVSWVGAGFYYAFLPRMLVDMSTIAIAGATGFIGRSVVSSARLRGYRVVELSRSTGVDLLSGEGLAGALAGVDKLVDVSQVVDPLAKDTRTPILEAANNLLTAARDEGIKRVVMLSINGVDKPRLQQFPFYLSRYEQEKLVLDSGLLATVVRSVQWFEFALNPAAAVLTDSEVSVQNWAIQPAAMDSVAQFLVEAVEGNHGEGIVTVAGSQRLTLPQLTRRVLDSRGDSRPVVTVEAALPALGDGSLYAPDSALILEPSLDEWLAGRSK